MTALVVVIAGVLTGCAQVTPQTWCGDGAERWDASDAAGALMDGMCAVDGVTGVRAYVGADDQIEGVNVWLDPLDPATIDELLAMWDGAPVGAAGDLAPDVALSVKGPGEVGDADQGLNIQVFDQAPPLPSSTVEQLVHLTSLTDRVTLNYGSAGAHSYSVGLVVDDGSDWHGRLVAALTAGADVERALPGTPTVGGVSLGGLPGAAIIIPFSLDGLLDAPAWQETIEQLPAVQRAVEDEAGESLPAVCVFPDAPHDEVAEVRCGANVDPELPDAVRPELEELRRLVEAAGGRFTEVAG